MGYETDRMSLEGYNRRSKAVNLIESPGFKITQTIITVILIPFAAWGCNLVLDKLSKIDTSINVFTTQQALMDQRLHTNESDVVRLQADLRALQDKVTTIDYAERRLDERSQQVILGGKR